MSRKDYEAFARMIREHNEHEPAPSELNGQTVLSSISGTLADYFERDNPRFDRARFFEACGYTLTSEGWR